MSNHNFGAQMYVCVCVCTGEKVKEKNDVKDLSILFFFKVTPEI